MCGIFGVASIGRGISRSERSWVEHGTASLSHRGPDGDGYWSDDSVAFGHRRLAIIDLSDTGRQPMVSHSGRFIVTYNGEIYNFRELGAELAANGWQPRGTSDTEVLLGALERWAVEHTLAVLDGMFAVAIYDTHLSRFHLARDRFGEKPLHYAELNGKVWFSSELRGIEALPNFERRIGVREFDDYFRFGLIPGDRTIFSGVHRVPPSSILSWDLRGGARNFRQYARISSRNRADDDELLGLLRRSVTRRLISDRPVGTFLSGGIDSSLVTALAAEASDKPVQTFNLSWSDREYDESRQAQQVARILGATHSRIHVSRPELLAATNSLTGVLDEPFGDSSLLATTLVSRFARNTVVVALSGDGGDELFAGYNRHIWMTRLARLQRMPLYLRRFCSSSLSRSRRALAKVVDPIPTRFRPRLIEDKMLKLSRALTAPELDQAYQTIVAIDDSIGSPLTLDPKVCEGLRGGDLDGVLLAIRRADIEWYLPDDILTKVDRATMSCGLESRAPFLNADLASAALSLGPADLIDRHGGKAPLRRMLAHLVPGVSFTQPKAGFGIPVASLLRGEMRSVVHDAITAHESRGLHKSNPWRRRMQQLEGGDDAPQHQLWSLLAFELWAADRNLVFDWDRD